MSAKNENAETKSGQRGSYIWISAGGTGGHISPAIAVAENFLQTHNNGSLAFVTLKKNKLYPDIQALSQDKRVTSLYYSAPHFPTNIKTALFFFPKLFASFTKLLFLFLQKKPMALVAFGGYPVFPALIFVLVLRVPFYLCEQNAMPGMVTRRFAKYAKKVFLSLPCSISLPNTKLCGNPLRQNIRDSFFDEKNIPLYRSVSLPVQKKEKKHILFVGGSQGAKDLNELYLALIADDFFSKYSVEISSGNSMYKEMSAAAQAHNRKNDKVKSFIGDIHRALKQADIIISRSGSGMVFEICASGKPAIYVPFPFAADNHQAANAEQLQKLQLAKVIDIRPFEKQSALAQLKTILADTKFFDNVSQLYKKDKLPLLFDAHQTIVEEIMAESL